MPSSGFFNTGAGGGCRGIGNRGACRACLQPGRCKVTSGDTPGCNAGTLARVLELRHRHFRRSNEHVGRQMSPAVIFSSATRRPYVRCPSGPDRDPHLPTRRVRVRSDHDAPSPSCSTSTSATLALGTSARTSASVSVSSILGAGTSATSTSAPATSAAATWGWATSGPATRFGNIGAGTDSAIGLTAGRGPGQCALGNAGSAPCWPTWWAHRAGQHRHRQHRDRAISTVDREVAQPGTGTQETNRAPATSGSSTLGPGTSGCSQPGSGTGVGTWARPLAETIATGLANAALQHRQPQRAASPAASTGHRQYLLVQHRPPTPACSTLQCQH